MARRILVLPSARECQKRHGRVQCDHFPRSFAMSDDVLLYEIEDNIATITLNRPEAMNALTRELYARLEKAVRDSHSDPDVRCVIITGTGRAFCSGDDVKQIM